jgi:hypothetical protein
MDILARGEQNHLTRQAKGYCTMVGKAGRTEYRTGNS